MKQPKKVASMTELLRDALREFDNFKAIERETGITRGSLSRFARGDQSLRLDLADKLATHFGIECSVRPKKGR